MTLTWLMPCRILLVIRYFGFIHAGERWHQNQEAITLI
jgi:hypothetical protein